VGVDAGDDRGVEAQARREEEAALVDHRHPDLARLPVVGDAQQVLGRVDDVVGDPEHPGVHVGRAARQAGERRRGAAQAVGRLVDRAVAAERDDDVVALAGRLARQRGGVVARLGVDRVNVVTPLQGVHHEVAQPVGDRCGVRVDDDQHALALDGGGERELVAEGFERRE
jgi:hypothetical protein